ncbi:uncharacterized protein SCHCODRAFT_02624360 [Schizophyllum commune H4-8]|uniref:Phosphotransferase n=1 Tax=Schizophyllum commune (strain H4-8 / FGSC 9210) TaxID=578458 RepID=D8PLF0_SCHCM|nr:uncharacterized protein SCHCODRAFT_02624360 [Schizophyllum commune H4-8]KAI5894326.1 hypothetical protein SCHCODRAFT_02624360 [Schizophyllum commune H4-8]
MYATAAHDHKTTGPQAVIDGIDRQFQLSKDSLVEITEAFLREFKQGLSKYGEPMAMIPTFVTGVPDGSETGTFLALDLGGTNLRVCEVVLNGDRTFDLTQQKYKVSDALKTGEATDLFDYLADSVDAFLTTHAKSTASAHVPGTESPYPTKADYNPEIVNLGLTFSFPVEQTALDEGKILTWTKGFSAKHAVGNDVVKLLQDAFDRKHLHVRCVALVNDTVGALLSRAYTGGGCTLGAIFGTGTNGAYVEQVANITKLANSPAAAKGGQMVINTEWGAFNNTRTHLPNTPYDTSLDRRSINPRFQAFEKFISGMYLGEITRNILVSLVDAVPKPLLFSGASSATLNHQWGLDTSVMSEVEEAWEAGREGTYSGKPIDAPDFESLSDEAEIDEKVKARLQKIKDIVVRRLQLPANDVSLRDAAIVRWACALVARRAGLLSGTAVAAVLIQTGRGSLLKGEPNGTNGKAAEPEDKFIVGVDGSLIQFYPNFEPTMREAIRMLTGESVEKSVEIGLAKDGSGVGAALCALQAIKQLA